MLHGLCGTIDLPRTSYPVLIKPVGEDLPDGQQLSLEEMKHTLRAAEERLSGRVLSQAKTQVYDAQASQATAYS